MGEQRQQNDIASCSNGKNMLIASDSLKITEHYYAGIFTEKEVIGDKETYSRIGLTLIKIGGSKEHVTFFMQPDQADYIYECSKKFMDMSYFSYRPGRQITINRQSIYNGRPSQYPWYIEIMEKDKKMFINLTDENFFVFMNRIHRFIKVFSYGYSYYIIQKKMEYDSKWGGKEYGI